MGASVACALIRLLLVTSTHFGGATACLMLLLLPQLLFFSLIKTSFDFLWASFTAHTTHSHTRTRTNCSCCPFILQLWNTREMNWMTLGLNAIRLRKSHVQHKTRALHFALVCLATFRFAASLRRCVRQRGEFLRNWIFAESFLSLAPARKAHEILFALSAVTIECSSSSSQRACLVEFLILLLFFFCGAEPVNRIINWWFNRMRLSSYTWLA